MIDLSDPGRTTELQRGDERAEGQAIESNKNFAPLFRNQKKNTTVNFVLLLCNRQFCPVAKQRSNLSCTGA